MTANINYELSDLENFRIRFEFEQKLSNSEDPDDFTTEITGKLCEFNEDTESFDIPVGEISLRKIELEQAWEKKVSLIEIFDGVDSDLCEHFESLFDIEENDFHPQLEDLVDPGLGSDLLIIEQVEIDPEYRGQNLGLFLMSRAIDSFGGGCRYIATKPSPLQDGLYKNAITEQKTRGFDKFVAKGKAATKKISDHWKKLGFVEVPDSSGILITSPLLRRPLCGIN